MGTIVELLAINAAVSAVCFLALWRIGVALKDVTFVDAWWALGMLVLAVSSYVVTWPASPHKFALTCLTTAWALRLGFHLLVRWRTQGKDRRYVTMMGKAESQRGWSYAKASLLLVFATQAPLQFIVALPVQLGQLAPDDTRLGPVGLAGVVLACVGLTFEALGDWQLAHFKADPANKGKVLDRGLWRYTRHPNYFGDVCVWWGLFLIALETHYGAWSLPGPILLTFLLTRWSGVPTVEGRLRRTRPAYEAYVARTSGFVPWFPKKG